MLTRIPRVIICLSIRTNHLMFVVRGTQGSIRFAMFTSHCPTSCCSLPNIVNLLTFTQRVLKDTEILHSIKPIPQYLCFCPFLYANPHLLPHVCQCLGQVAHSSARPCIANITTSLFELTTV